jgi:hypothetical protein
VRGFIYGGKVNAKTHIAMHKVADTTKHLLLGYFTQSIHQAINPVFQIEIIRHSKIPLSLTKYKPILCDVVFELIQFYHRVQLNKSRILFVYKKRETSEHLTLNRSSAIFYVLTTGGASLSKRQFGIQVLRLDTKDGRDYSG